MVVMASFGGSDVSPPPAARSTAAYASTRPAPQPSEHWLDGSAVSFRMFSTSSAVRVGSCASISATMPATCGVAMLVPWYHS